MRRIFACVLALMLLCCAALGEAGSFSFRNGVVWGMTEDEVLAAEGQPADYEVEPFGDGARKLEIDDLELNGVEYELDYIFVGGALRMARYEFDGDEVPVDGLVELLDGKYTRGDGDFDRFLALGNALTDGANAGAALRDGDFFYDWSAPGGTCVALTNCLSEDGDDIEIFYFDAPSIEAGGVALSDPAPALNPEDF